MKSAPTITSRTEIVYTFSQFTGLSLIKSKSKWKNATENRISAIKDLIKHLHPKTTREVSDNTSIPQPSEIYY